MPGERSRVRGDAGHRRVRGRDRTPGGRCRRTCDDQEIEKGAAMPKRLDARFLRRRGRPSRVLRAAVSGLAALCIAGAASAQERVERSEEHTSELQSLMRISYAVFCLNKKT